MIQKILKIFITLPLLSALLIGQPPIAKSISNQLLMPLTHLESHSKIDYGAKGNETISFDLEISHSEIEDLIRKSVLGTTILPELVFEDQIKVPQDYKRIENKNRKHHYRKKLLDYLLEKWKIQFSQNKAERLARHFIKLSQQLDEEGAIIFGDLINRKAFAKLVEQYDATMASYGSNSLLHSYLNLRNHPEFLGNNDFNHAFIHPLLIALMSYRMGGPVRMVDARAKDTGPMTARAQDNMLHIDNTPFNDEYKILVNWLLGKAEGPNGQNFVYVPGTHKGIRNSFVGKNGHAWSTENGSIFITDKSVNHLLAFQKRAIGHNSVVELQSPKPTSTLFAAGSLVHHRYRTHDGKPRSALIVAFHPAIDNPGEFIDGISQTSDRSLENMLFGFQGKTTEKAFLQSLSKESLGIADKMSNLLDQKSASTLIEPTEKTMDEKEIDLWKEIVTEAPSIEEIKLIKQKFEIGALHFKDLMAMIINQLMYFDKHGPLDLILYHDSHEETRKWARNRIREMKLSHLQKRLSSWSEEIKDPQRSDILTIEEIDQTVSELNQIVRQLSQNQIENGELHPYEKISSENAFISIDQLLKDLAEAIKRCDSFQNFLSTSLFIFWATDELHRLLGGQHQVIQTHGGKLLRHYLATAIVERKRSLSAFKEEILTTESNLDTAI